MRGMHNRINRRVALFDHEISSDKCNVMVAKYNYQALAYRVEVLKCLQRTLTPVDQITGQPELISGRIEIDLLQKFPEGPVAALDIAYRPDHGAAFG